MIWTGKKRVLKALKGEPTDRMPAVSVCQYATYELMDETDAHWPEAHRDAALMAQLAAGGKTVLGLDAVRVPFCQTVEAEIYGAVVNDGGGKHVPSIAQPAYEFGEVPDIPENFLSRGRIPAVLEAIQRLKKDVGEDTAVMGSIVGPFSVAASLVGIPSFLKATLRKPDAIVPYLEAATKTAIEYGQAMIAAGADVIVIEDMMASLDMISPRTYRQHASPYERQVISAFAGKVPVIIHICGRLDAVMKDIAETGATAISVESTVDIPAARKLFADAGIHTPIIGAVHPMHALLEGTESDVAAAVKKSAVDGVSLVSPDCAVAPATPIANLQAMVNTAHSIKRNSI